MTPAFGGEALEWMGDADCAAAGIGADLWHSTDRQESRAARRICQGCPVAAQCRQYALDNPGLSGIWGGLTERERRGMQRYQRYLASA